MASCGGSVSARPKRLGIAWQGRSAGQEIRLIFGDRLIVFNAKRRFASLIGATGGAAVS
jgi:hypothetical protein